MRMTNRQLDIIINKIYEQVSLPIIEENTKRIERVNIRSDRFMKDLEKEEELNAKKKEIDDELNALYSKWAGKEYKGYSFPKYMYALKLHKDSYIHTQRKKEALVNPYPSKEEIEAEIMLSSNSDIKQMIEEIIEKYKKKED